MGREIIDNPSFSGVYLLNVIKLFYRSRVFVEKYPVVIESTILFYSYICSESYFFEKYLIGIVFDDWITRIVGVTRLCVSSKYVSDLILNPMKYVSKQIRSRVNDIFQWFNFQTHILRVIFQRNIYVSKKIFFRQNIMKKSILLQINTISKKIFFELLLSNQLFSNKIKKL